MKTLLGLMIFALPSAVVSWVCLEFFPEWLAAYPFLKLLAAHMLSGIVVAYTAVQGYRHGRTT